MQLQQHFRPQRVFLRTFCKNAVIVNIRISEDRTRKDNQVQDSANAEGWGIVKWQHY